MLQVVFCIVAVATAVGVVAGIAGLWTAATDLWTGPLARQLRAARSLRGPDPNLESLLRPDAPSKGDDAETKVRWIQRPGRRLRGWLAQARWRRTPRQLVLVSLVLAVAGSAAGVFAGLPLPLSVAAGPLAACLPIAWLVVCGRRRVRQAESQLPAALDALVNSLQCGHTLQAGLKAALEATSDPLRQDLDEILQAVNLGTPWDNALDEFARRMPTRAAGVLASAMRMHCRLGSNVTRVMQMVGQMARERLDLARQVRALSAEVRLSGILLASLPWLAFGAVYYISPNYLMVLFDDDFGRKMVTAAVVLQVVGILVIRKIVNARR